MTIFTKTANDWAAPNDSSGNARQIVPHDVQVWGTEVERILGTGGFSAADAVGSFSDRTTYDAEAQGFTFVSIDGDGASIDSAVAFVKESATSGDWSVAIPIQGEKGWSPLFRIVNDGARRVLELYDWSGGEGEKPDITGYVGAAGITATIGEGIDIRGPAGPAGAGTGDMLASVYDPQGQAEDIFARVDLPSRDYAITSFQPASAPESIVVRGFYAAGDGGGAIYANPVTVDPGKTDQISITAGGTATYYNRLHAEGVVDFAKHGLHLDGREEVALFEDAFAVALDRGLKKLRMPGGKSILLTEAAIPAGSFDVDFGLGSTVLADFNGALTGGTANAIRALLGTSDDKLILRNLHVDGQYDGTTTLTAQNRILDIDGYGYVGLFNYGMKAAGRAGTNETLILDRNDRHTNIHNAYMVEVDGADFDGNAKFEGLVVQSSDKRTRYSIRRVKFRNHISSGTPVSVFNCAPGEVKFCDIDGLTNSAMNLLTEDVEAAFNIIKNVSNSHAIDLYEGGLFYAHRANVHHNYAENIGSTDGGVGVRGCGNGLRITDNTFKDCLHGASVESNISGTGATYGDWLTTTATDISGVVIAGNKNLGHNEQASATNANLRVLGESTAKIEVEITVSESTAPSIKTEDGITLEHFSVATINGRLVHGRDGLVRISADGGVLRLRDCVFAPEVGQGVGVVTTVAANVDKIIFDNCQRPAALDSGYADVMRVTSGIIGEVQFNDGQFYDGSSLDPAGSISGNGVDRVLTNRKIAYSGTVAYTGTIAAGGRQDVAVTVTGARTGTDQVFGVATTSSTNIFVSGGRVTANDEVTFRLHNPTSSDVTDPSLAVTAYVGP